MKYKYNTRYQGAIILNDQILLIKHSHYKDGMEYWVLPGGGREEGETEEECVKREIKEETNLDVIVEKIVVELRGRPDNYYPLYKTYLCKPITFDAKPGYEPEASIDYVISDLCWYDLHDESDWPISDLTLPKPADYINYHTLKKIQKLLGYDK